jgi:hypothetical protein
MEMEWGLTMRKMDNIKPHKYIHIIFITSLFLFIGGYTLFQAKNLIVGPRLTIAEPENGATLYHGLYSVSGSAQNISSITLNDQPIFVDDYGNFHEKLIAPPGYSIMKMAVKDRFGRSKEKYIHLVNLEEKEELLFDTEVDSSLIESNSDSSIQ